MFKECRICGWQMHLIHFVRMGDTKDGFSDNCLACDILSLKQYYKQNRKILKKENPEFMTKYQKLIKTIKKMQEFEVKYPGKLEEIKGEALKCCKWDPHNELT